MGSSLKLPGCRIWIRRLAVSENPPCGSTKSPQFDGERSTAIALIVKSRRDRSSWIPELLTVGKAPGVAYVSVRDIARSNLPAGSPTLAVPNCDTASTTPPPLSANDTANWGASSYDGQVHIARGETEQGVAYRSTDQVGCLRLAFTFGRKNSSQPKSFQRAAGQGTF